jgi:hypothetical protein
MCVTGLKLSTKNRMHSTISRTCSSISSAVEHIRILLIRVEQNARRSSGAGADQEEVLRS